jgi:hypothetical protein
MAKKRNYKPFIDFLTKLIAEKAYHLGLPDKVENKIVKYLMGTPKVEPDRSDDEHRVLEQLWGALQPFSDIIKDWVDTLKPYKSNYYVDRDLLQLVYGIGNVGKATVTVIGTPILFIAYAMQHLYDLAANTVKYLYDPAFRSVPTNFVATFVSDMKENIARSGFWLLEGLANIVRGVTQIITAPLTLMRVSVRLGITRFKGQPKIEDSEAIQRLVNQGLEILRPQKSGSENKELELIPDDNRGIALDRITMLLHEKYKKGNTRGIPTEIDANNEEELFNPKKSKRVIGGNYYSVGKMTKEKLQHAYQYLGVFRKQKNKSGITQMDAVVSSHTENNASQPSEFSAK